MTGVEIYADPMSAGINMWYTPWVDPSWVPYKPRVGVPHTWWANAASLHPGGCNFTLGDGSVHFIAQTVDKKVLLALATMSGGEVFTLP
jgi:prepilin-type processing-associated H-X9-DG protein